MGLIAVFVVLLILGIGYYFKKHVPDKFDKFLSYGVDVTSPVTEKPPGKKMTSNVVDDVTCTQASTHVHLRLAISTYLYIF